MKKVLNIVAAIAIVAAGAMFVTWYTILLLPVVVLLLAPLNRVKVNTRKFGDIKTLPSEDKDPAKTWLNGNWELEYPGGGPESIKLPSDLAAIRGMASMKGPFRYTKRGVEIAPAEGKRLFLCGRGIGGRAKFSMNGNLCGEAPGYVPFEIDVTESVGGGGPFDLVAEVYPGARPYAPGNLDGLAPPYAIGIFRELYIESRDTMRLHQAWFHARGPLQYLSVELAGKSEFPSALMVSVKNAAGKEVFRGEKIAPEFEGYSVVTFGMELGTLELWAPKKPVLYRVQVMLVSGEVRKQAEFVTGLKTVELVDGSILINGEAPDLRGAVRCEHYPPYGASVPAWAAKKDAQSLKESALDFAYCQDYPPHPDFLAACDRAGVHVAAEFPYARVAAEAGPEEAERIFSECVLAAECHPSFLFYVLPENSGAPEFSDKSMANRVAHVCGFKSTHSDACVIKLNVDLYSFGHYARQLHRYAELGRPGLLVLNYIDTEAARESRNKRELRKTDADLETLKLADKSAIGPLAIGQLFTWGLMSGINSINRKKKASADAISAYLRTRSVGEITWAELPAHLPYRMVAMTLLVIMAIMLVIPSARSFYFTAPPTYMSFFGLWFPGIMQIAALALVACTLANHFNWDRRGLTAAAPLLGFPSFMRLYTSYGNRVAVILSANTYLAAAAVLLVSLVTGSDPLHAAGPVMAASFFEILFVAITAGPVRPLIIMAAVAVMEAAFMAWFVPPAAVAVFAAVKFLPWVALFVWFDTKNVFAEK